MNMFDPADDLLQLNNAYMDEIWNSADLAEVDMPYSDLCSSSSMSLASVASPDVVSDSASVEDCHWGDIGGEHTDETEVCSVILCDRMITEANLPIKTEHSYCNVLQDAAVDPATIALKMDVDDVESECYPAISMQAATTRHDPAIINSCDTDQRQHSAGAPTPSPHHPAPTARVNSGAVGGVKVATTSQPIRSQLMSSAQSSMLLPSGRRVMVTSQRDSTNKNSEHSRSLPAQIRISSGSSLLKQQTILLTTSSSGVSASVAHSSSAPHSPISATHNGEVQLCSSVESISSEGNSVPGHPHRISVKVEPANGFNLPPTPPSLSDSDDSCSTGPTVAPLSPIRAVIQPRSAPKVFISSARPTYRSITSTNTSSGTRDYGCLVLTEEEKRTLIAEGYPVPSRLPLSKSEEKSLKKIRRKIKNKISAQESRRKKKEYMDQMERRLDRLTAEKEEFRSRVDQLENQRRQLQLQNAQLIQQLMKLQQKQTTTAPPSGNEVKQVAIKSEGVSNGPK